MSLDIRFPKGKFLPQPFSQKQKEEWLLDIKFLPFRLGSSVGAAPFIDIKRIRDRIGLSTTQAFITLDNIIKERHLELAFEGTLLKE